MSAKRKAPTQPRRRLPAAQRRARILEEASRLFAEEGYEGASIDRIASAAGVSAPVIYDHFQSKKALYGELLRLHAGALVEATTRTEASASLERLLRDNVAAFFAFVEENPAAWRMLFRDPAPDPEIAALQRRIQAAATARLAETLLARAPRLRLSARLERRRADELIAELGKSALNGMAGWWWDHREVPREALVAVAMDVLWTGLRSLAADVRRDRGCARAR
jgi:AcrR family transcriptional regulator